MDEKIILRTHGILYVAYARRRSRLQSNFSLLSWSSHETFTSDSSNRHNQQWMKGNPMFTVAFYEPCPEGLERFGSAPVITQDLPADITSSDLGKILTGESKVTYKGREVPHKDILAVTTSKGRDLILVEI